jgi:hypothetical protein
MKIAILMHVAKLNALAKYNSAGPEIFGGQNLRELSEEVFWLDFILIRDTTFVS